MSEQKILATVDGINITDAEIDAFISNLPREQQMYAQNPQFRQQCLDEILAIHLYAKMGKEENLEETEEFKTFMANAKKDILAQLVEMWKHDDMTASDRELLIRLNEYLGGGDENERLHRENIAYFIENGSDFEVISAYHKLICHYISLENFGKAADTLAELFSKADVEKYKGINLFLFILEDSVEIIPHLADGAELWHWAKPFICQLKGRFYGNLYKKSLDAALSQNDEMADEIKADFDRWLELTKLKP